MTCTEKEDTSQKGAKAEKLIVQMIINGLFPIPNQASKITENDLQVSGGDIFIKPNLLTHDDGILIQVKCDYRGGERHLGGTGNLFLQISEINPLRKH